MKILFISIGKNHDSDLGSPILDYTKRLEKYFKTEWKIIPSSDVKKEGEQILKNIDSGDYVLALDEKGKEVSTLELAGLVEKRMIAGDKRLVFVIGGSYGLDQTVLEKANYIWSLSKLTFPHQIVRLVLTEAIYRAVSVIKNEPYHHR
ncbi:MAG: 23S rRNA (pseudouridine(1915)-N(3))-methyltransferase RlmH [bacterium]